MNPGVSTARRIYNLGSTAHIPPGEGRVFRISGTDVALFHTRAGHFFATQPACPHRGGPLADGLVGSGKVLCPLHGYAFELATGRALENSCAHLRTYPVTVNSANELLITLEE